MHFTDRLSNFQRMALHSETLFRHDGQRRLCKINEPGFPSPPRFWMGRTRVGNQWAFHHELPSTIVAELDTLCRNEPTTTDLRQPLQNERAIKDILATDTAISAEYRGPAYAIPDGATGPDGATAPGQTRRINATNAALLRPHFADLLEPYAYHEVGPVAAVIEDGCAVSVCFCSRLPGRATEAGLHTHPDYRGRGYAAAVVASWAAAVREHGCLPLYSTSWENLASQAVAHKLGMMMYGADWSLG
jgi:GNAT superfamily N-acetyltransferase